jgi:hypothetical protein
MFHKCSSYILFMHSALGQLVVVCYLNSNDSEEYTGSMFRVEM